MTNTPIVVDPMSTSEPDDRGRAGVRRRIAVMMLAVALVATGCTTKPVVQTRSGGADGAGASAGAPGGVSDGTPSGGKKVDACTLLTAAEVTAIIGSNDGGGPGDGVGESVCTWENAENYHSITVSIGSAGTAADGQLPEVSAYGTTEPGPDGIRFAPGNVAEFVVGNRACEIQVVTSVTSNSDRPAAVRLVGLVRSRI
ncbi:hypothetical protein ACWDV4_12985 [Micromonospora sp. NPDC003197]